MAFESGLLAMIDKGKKGVLSVVGEPLVRYKNRNEQIHHRLPSDWTGKK